jgi:hypothetical protein
MAKILYQLKPNLIAEPLFANWYAWCNLISPATAALTIANNRLPILESYLKAPKEHAAALKIPSLRGGTFFDAEGNDYLLQTEQLLLKTKLVASDLLLFASALKKLCFIIDTECINGFSMLSIYDQIPSELKGYIELLYDLNNRPSFRFIESLLYKSKYYKVELQSVKFSLGNIDARPFVLSTPRFTGDADIEINLPFLDPFYDMIFSTRSKPSTTQFLREAHARIPGIEWDTFLRMFNRLTSDNQDRSISAFCDKMVIKYFGHACLLVE